MNKTAATYLETLATLRRDLTEAETRAKQLREAIAVIERLVPQEELFPSPRRPTSGGQEALGRLTMIDAAEHVLKDEGRPMHIMQIVEKMLDRGFEYSRGKNSLRASLTGSIERKRQFERVAPATYGLRIWSKNGDREESDAGAAE